MRAGQAFEIVRARLYQAWLRQWLPTEAKRFLQRTSPYEDWRSCNRLTQTRRDDLADAVGRHAIVNPAISVIMPVFKAEPGLLEAAVKSVQQQCFLRWELCICDDGSNDSALTALLRRLTDFDPRIRVTTLASNGGISTATNAAAAMASAPLLLFLDQDDLLPPACLAEFVLAFAQDENIDLAYSDNDKIDLADRHIGPAFKPGWSPALLLSHMYVGHALAVKSALFHELGGMRSEYDGSQDYDFLLRASEKARRVVHLPDILYHWRILPGSTALSAKEKPASIAAGRRAVEDALIRRGVCASVERPEWAERAGIGLFSLKFMPPSRPVGVIVYSHDSKPPDKAWLKRLSNMLPTGSQIIDAAASNVGQSLAKQLTAAIQLVRGMPLLLLRSGAKPTHHDCFSQLFGYMCITDAGVAGGRVIGADGKLLNCGFVRPSGADKAEPAFAGLAAHRPGNLYLARVARECFAVSADCLLMAPELVDALGPVPSDVHDSYTLGLWISHWAWASGRSVLCCHDGEVAVQQPLVTTIRAHVQRVDAWYNRNLGAGRTQFLPARRTGPSKLQKVLNVAAVSHNLDREGAQSLLVDLLCELKSQGVIDPIVITPKGGELQAALAEAEIPILYIAPVSRRISAKQLGKRVAALAAAYRKAGADVVLANTLEMYAAVEAAELAGLSALWWQHEGGSWHKYFKTRRPWIKARAFAAFNIAYRVIQVADFTRKAWLPVALRDNFQLIRHGIAPERLAGRKMQWSRMTARAELQISDETLCIVLMGSISARKGQLDIVRALALLPQEVVARLHIKIVGATVDRSYGERIAAALEALPEAKRIHVELVGRVADPALYYNAADVLVCCSRQESAPLAIVEAMHFGVPVVTTPVDGIPELVEFGGNALAYDPGDVIGLAGVIDDLASSIEPLARLRTRSLEMVQDANKREMMIERFAQLLREAAMLRRTVPSPPLG